MVARIKEGVKKEKKERIAKKIKKKKSEQGEL